MNVLWVYISTRRHYDALVPSRELLTYWIISVGLGIQITQCSLLHVHRVKFSSIYTDKFHSSSKEWRLTKVGYAGWTTVADGANQLVILLLGTTSLHWYWFLIVSHTCGFRWNKHLLDEKAAPQCTSVVKLNFLLDIAGKLLLQRFTTYKSIIIIVHNCIN